VFTWKIYNMNFTMALKDAMEIKKNIASFSLASPPLISGTVKF
jgi:hypothetical protein